MPLDRFASGTLNSARMPDGASYDTINWTAQALADLGQGQSLACVGADWTTELVGEALISAMRWVRAVGGPSGPCGMVSAAFPTAVLSLEEFLGQGWGLPETADGDGVQERELILPPTAKQVSRHMAALQWPADYLCPQNVGSARMLGLWAVCKVSRRSFAGAVTARGVSRHHAYSLRDRGLSLISQGLERDRVPLEA